MVEAAKTKSDKEKVKDVTLQNLINWGVVKNLGDEFVLKHINLGAEINGLVRTDAYELPTEAIREAVVNATTHRNFLDRECVQVAVYDDRVEIIESWGTGIKECLAVV